MVASRGQYRITNRLGSRQCLGIGGENYIFEAGEERILRLFPYEAVRFEAMGAVFTVVELEAGEDPSSEDFQRASNEDANVVDREKELIPLSRFRYR